jgi:hypothetical protein
MNKNRLNDKRGDLKVNVNKKNSQNEDDINKNKLNFLKK